jgi:cyclic pyranopterin phosphate synthase
MAFSSHFDTSGACRMVDVSDKASSLRTARASGQIRMRPATLQAILEGGVRKGNVWEVARLAGIMAAKRTSETIPLCHQIPLTSVEVQFQPSGTDAVTVEATVKTVSQTGVEMEALSAVSAAMLTVYDMCKSMDREIQIERIRLEEKSGGRSGTYRRESGARPSRRSDASTVDSPDASGATSPGPPTDERPMINKAPLS